MRKIKLTESQLNRFINEGDINNITMDNVAKTLINSFNCDKTPHNGGDFKDLISGEVAEFGFKEVIVKFLKRDDVKNLHYLIYTEGPIFKVVVESAINEDKPCLSIIEVINYNK